VGTLLHAIVYVSLYNLLNVLVYTANKMGLQKKVALILKVCALNNISFVRPLLGDGTLDTYDIGIVVKVGRISFVVTVQVHYLA
jgi:hypothetical protein